MTYEMAGEALIPRMDRECGHPYLQEAGECELCDVDWLLETEHAEDPEYLTEARAKLARAAFDESESVYAWAERRGDAAEEQQRREERRHG